MEIDVPARFGGELYMCCVTLQAFTREKRGRPLAVRRVEGPRNCQYQCKVEDASMKRHEVQTEEAQDEP